MESFDLANVLSQLSALVTTWGLKVIGAIAVLIIGRMVARRIRRGISGLLERRGADPALKPFLSGIGYWMTMVLVVVAVLGLFGIPTASFVAVLGAAGLAVGLALQGTLSNFAAGVMLLVFRPFRIDDLVEIAGAEGVVREIGIFSTTIDSTDNVEIIIPNTEVFGKLIKNYTGNQNRRIDLVIGVGYDDDLQVARKAIMDAVESSEGVLTDPAPTVEVAELGDSSVNFVVRPWCDSNDYWAVCWEVTRNVKLALDAAGCSIPYPQRDVHLYKPESAA